MSYRGESNSTSMNGQRSISPSTSESRGQDFSKAGHGKTSSAFVLGGSDASCKECGKHVYEMEKIIADQIVYHKACFRCTQCKKLLNASTFTSNGGILYCKPHFIELFRPKGQSMNEDDQENERDSEGEEILDTPALPAVKDMKGLFEVHGQASESFSPRAISFKSNQKNISASKWEKSTERPPTTPVNRIDDDNPDEDFDILPPADITRNLVSKFRQLERGDGSDVPVVPKPIRQFTPPRESPDRSKPDVACGPVDVATDVVRSGDPAELEDELPPPCITRNLVAMFGSRNPAGDGALESVERRSSSRVTGQSGLVTSRHKSVGLFEEIERTNGGVSENEPEEKFNVVRESDPLDEADLPETGMARALVAQWKSLQMEAEMSRQQSPSSTTFTVTSITSARPPPSGKVGMQNANLGLRTANSGTEADVAETGGIQMEESPEDELPPQDITRNLLAKFRTIEVDQESNPSQISSKKQFKWDVKEAKPINYPGLVTVSKTSYSEDRLDQGESSEEELPEQDDDEEKPQPAYTKLMLEKFQNMEMS